MVIRKNRTLIIRKILAYKQRNPNLLEKDASGVPYWWPRYLMLDLIPEALFVDNEGKEIVGAHIIDITKTQSSDQSIYLVRDKNGRVCEGKIFDFLFWLLEPNVGIGLWPNYWKRELVRCHDRDLKKVDYQEVGISDRVVLNNFLKAGQDFIKIKRQTNNLLDKDAKETDEKYLSTSVTDDTLYSSLYNTLSYLSLKYSMVLVGQNQVSLWLCETIKSLVLQKYPQQSIKEALEEIFEFSLSIIKSITHDDVAYCIQNSNDKSLLNKGSLVPSIKVNANDILYWLSNQMFVKRICEMMIDSLLSQPLAPLLEISPLVFGATQSLINFSTLLQHTETFAIISDKTSLLTHQIYPFICGKGDYPINIVGVHSSWIISKSNLVKRALIYNPNSHSFIEGDLEKPLIIDYGLIVELFIDDDEVKRYAELTREYESAGLRVINSALISRERADDKLWIRENRPNDVVIPKYIVLSQQDFESKDNKTIKKIEEFLSSLKKGVVIQPSANTTESSYVQFLPSTVELNSQSVLDASKNIHQALNVSKNASISVLVSEFRGNINYNGAPVVFRFNVSESKISVAAYVGGSSGLMIVGLKGTRKASNLEGYCEHLDVVLNNLYDETQKEKISITCTYNKYQLIGISCSIQLVLLLNV